MPSAWFNPDHLEMFARAADSAPDEVRVWEVHIVERGRPFPQYTQALTTVVACDSECCSLFADVSAPFDITHGHLGILALILSY
jgi:hypothetical protein